MSEAAVEAHRLVKRYGSRSVLNEVSFSVARAELFCLLGPNGAGKTTTVEILEGYSRPDSGSALILGTSPGSREAKLATGLMLQEGGVHPGIKVSEALHLYSCFYPSPLSPDEVAGALGIENIMSSKVRTLSGGEKQRMNRALAIVGAPRLLFLDEPTTGMDPIARADTWDLLQRLRDEGTAILLTTHGLQEAEYLADRIAILAHGRIGALGAIDELCATDTLRFTTASQIDIDEMRRAAGLDIQLDKGGYATQGASDPATMARIAQAAAMQGAAITSTSTGSTLEDLYRAIVEAE